MFRTQPDTLRNNALNAVINILRAAYRNTTHNAEIINMMWMDYGLEQDHRHTKQCLNMPGEEEVIRTYQIVELRDGERIIYSFNGDNEMEAEYCAEQIRNTSGNPAWYEYIGPLQEYHPDEWGSEEELHAQYLAGTIDCYGNRL